MAGRDATGPLGEGPGTGRGMGPCSGDAVPQVGFGRGHRRRWWSRAAGFWGWPRWGTASAAEVPSTRADEVVLLKAEGERLRAQLEALDRRLAEIEPEG